MIAIEKGGGRYFVTWAGTHFLSFLLLSSSRQCYFFCLPKQTGGWSSERDIYLLQACPFFVFSVNKPLDCTSLSDTYFCWLLYKLPVLYSTSASLLLICCSWCYRCSLWSGVLFLPLLFLVKESILFPSLNGCRVACLLLCAHWFDFWNSIPSINFPSCCWNTFAGKPLSSFP